MNERENLTIPIKMPIADAEVYGKVQSLSLQSLYYTNHGEFPSCFFPDQEQSYADYRLDTKQILSDILASDYVKGCNVEHILYTKHDINTKEEHVGVCLVIRDKKLYARIEEDVDETYILYDEASSEGLNWIMDIIKKNYKKKAGDDNNIWKIALSNGSFTLLKSKVSECPGFDVRKQYNDDFLEEDAIISEFIAEDNKSGLVILHGEKGTGKTTYIRNLILNNKDKKFIFVPSNLVTMLGEPSFGGFIGKLTNSIMILEDCEGAIQSRKSGLGSSSAVSLILNMTDGLLSDDLSMKFICTFNENTKNIDSALLRKGRLVSKYEFKPLCAEKTNNLLAELYTFDENEELPNKPMTLADIYNYRKKAYQNDRKQII